MNKVNVISHIRSDGFAWPSLEYFLYDFENLRIFLWFSNRYVKSLV